MTDPFAVLRLDVPAVAPDPAFAARLRARLQRALTLPPGVSVSSVPDLTPSESAPATAPVLGAAVPYLAVPDARAAIEWYIDVFGAELAYDPIVMPDGRVGHCELRLAGGMVYLADESPEIGVVAPSPGASAISLMLAVDDADATRAAAMERGATGDREVYDAYDQRNAWIVDPFGHRWGLHSPVPAAVPDPRRPRQGDVIYAYLTVPDADRAAAFYRDVLGWSPQGGDGRYQVDSAPDLGIGGGDMGLPNLTSCYVVDDLAAARTRVTGAGGSAGPAEQRPYGLVADCTDDEGTAFSLFQATPEDRLAVAGPGSLTYLTLNVRSSQRFRDFYGSVLGWRFSPGQMADGWEVEGSTPMIGVAGGQPANQAAPMWEVDDIRAAVERVRAAGGTSGDPDQRPYGWLAECQDDQGTPFYLGQTQPADRLDPAAS